MKRSELLLKLQRYYTQKHVMVEQGYITYQEFMDQVLQLTEELGMLPPTRVYWNSKNPESVNEKGVPKDLQIDMFNGREINEWEPENE